jgi:phospholipase C
VTEERKDSFASKPWQAKISRRAFMGTGAALAGAGALAGFLPEGVLRAAAASAGTASRGFDLTQVKHLVFLMQENRSFDHYFGTFPGVAGFSDPRAIRLPDGRSVFQQPDPSNPDGYLEPFHMSTLTTGAAAIPDLSHDWRIQHASWNGGKMDSWLRAHIAADGPAHGPYTMGYHTQEDIPFHWALAQAFTLLDQYHCSVMGPTDPNRAIWQNGTNDPQGMGGGPILETVTPPSLTFQSGAETMFNAGVTLKCYLGGGGPNTWPWFANFKSTTALPLALRNAVLARGTLFGDGTPGGIGNPDNPTPESVTNMAFEEDCANGVLPDVSFLGTLASEHPSGLPAAGAAFLAQIVNALAANQDLFNSTVLVIQYDENDGFFDHVPPPVPDKDQFPEEFVTKASAAGTPGGDLPVGAGFRVPSFVISPWSVGGNIFSGVSDHSSCLRLIESVAVAGGLSGRGPVVFPFISRWRRQTFGDLTGALSGAAQPAPTSPEFDPATRAANLAAQTAASTLPQPAIPGQDQTMPVQVKK